MKTRINDLQERLQDATKEVLAMVPKLGFRHHHTVRAIRHAEWCDRKIRENADRATGRLPLPAGHLHYWVPCDAPTIVDADVLYLRQPVVCYDCQERSERAIAMSDYEQAILATLNP